MQISQKIITIIYNFVVKLINQRAELKIWQKSDRKGNTSWQVFDLITGYSTSFNSEQEVRIWLEECYFRYLK